MAIQNIAGNVGSIVGNSRGMNFTVMSALLQNTVGWAQASLSSLWDGGFVGIDTDNVTLLTDEIEKYVKSLMDVVDKFNTNANIDIALKGKARDAAVEYVDAIKTLLNAYVSTYRNFNERVKEAVEAMSVGDLENANVIRSDAQDILTQANNIRVD